MLNYYYYYFYYYYYYFFFRIRLAIAVRRMSLFEAFAFFDSDRKGGLSAGKLWAGLDWLEVSLYIYIYNKKYNSYYVECWKIMGWA